MEKNVLINLTSINTVDDDSSKIELTTSGTLRSLKNGGFELKYEESEVTGFGGSTTSLTLLGNNLVNLNRTGTAPSDLILEKDKKHNATLYLKRIKSTTATTVRHTETLQWEFLPIGLTTISAKTAATCTSSILWT